MPGFVLGVRIAKPSLAGGAVHGCGIIAWLIVGRDTLAQALQVWGLRLIQFFKHRRTLRQHLTTTSGAPGRTGNQEVFVLPGSQAKNPVPIQAECFLSMTATERLASLRPLIFETKWQSSQLSLCFSRREYALA